MPLLTGKVITPISTGNDFAAALQPDGKPVLGGTCSIGGVNNTWPLIRSDFVTQCWMWLVP